MDVPLFFQSMYLSACSTSFAVPAIGSPSPVAWKRRARDAAVGGGLGRVTIVDCIQPARRVDRLREISLALEFGWKRRDIGCGGLVPFPSFERHEVEQPILENGVTHRAPVHLLPVQVDRTELAIGDRGCPGIAPIVVGASMELVRAPFGNDGNRRTRTVPEL